MAQQAKQVPLMWTVVISMTIGFRGYEALPNDVPDIFYEFGTGEGDLIAPVIDDGSIRIDISAQFPFFNSTEDSLYVNSNGLLSFDSGVSRFVPLSFPLSDQRIVAPFWADVNTGANNGRVYYRETTDNETLTRATQDVHGAFAEMSQFSATWVFVSTWYGVTYYGGSTTSAVNSFQAVLITDGRHSFIIFNYGNIDWTTGTFWPSGGNSLGLGGIEAQAGYDAGDGMHYFSIPGSLEPGIVDVETTSNVNQTGRWVFRVDLAEILPHCCPKWTGADCDEIARYNCQDNNPCTDDNINNPLCTVLPNMFFAHDNPSQYIQCHPGPNLCYVMPCPGGLVWDPNMDNCNWP